MLAAIFASSALGIVWNVIAIGLMGGGLGEAFTAPWLIAGAFAGIETGLFTIWSRRRRNGKESFVDGIATYYLGILVYWAGYVFFQWVLSSAGGHGLAALNLDSQTQFLLIFLYIGTIPFGVVLIPLCFVSRHVLWKIYALNAAN